MTTAAVPAPSRRRRVAFYVAVAVGIALAVMGLGELLLLGVLGWFDAATLDDVYPGASMHRMHLLGQAVIAWLIAIGVIAQPWRSPRTLGPAVIALVALVAYTGAALVAGVFDPLAVIGVAALAVIVWAHPGRSGAQVLPLRTRMLVFGAPIIAGSVIFAGQQVILQLSSSSAEPHAAIGHYAFTAAMAIGLAGAALIGFTSLPGRTLAASSAIGGTLYYGLASMVFPAEASSLGTTGGAVAVLAAAAYAVGNFTSAKSASDRAQSEPRPQLIA